ncbi:MAG: SUMF1/EgtB/PvdO family nonheme iron enzyme, partial [Myxococcales bacterium]|nr:SUMF1/EgtB/PvdO family nonheme iron enzyme [Myxococcales bacterium]
AEPAGGADPAPGGGAAAPSGPTERELANLRTILPQGPRLVPPAPASSSAAVEPWPPPITVPVGSLPQPPAPLPREPGACPSDMAAIDDFCIDRHEAPNQQGSLPFAFQTASDGEVWCGAVGKRLCTEAEWVRACRGPDERPFPYGAVRKPGTCNDDKAYRPVDWNLLYAYPDAIAFVVAAALYQAEPAGRRADCASGEGVTDLVGNVAEWVVRSFPNAHNHDHVLKGCYWAGCYNRGEPGCTFVNSAHAGSFRSYEAGFRCCLGRTP